MVELYLFNSLKYKHSFGETIWHGLFIQNFFLVFPFAGSNYNKSAFFHWIGDGSLMCISKVMRFSLKNNSLANGIIVAIKAFQGQKGKERTGRYHLYITARQSLSPS